MVAAILIRYIDIHPLIPPSAAVALVAAINAQGGRAWCNMAELRIGLVFFGT